MNIFIERTNKQITRRFSGTVNSLLKKIKINPEEVLVVRGEEVIVEDEKLKNSDTIKILSVISGG